MLTVTYALLSEMVTRTPLKYPNDSTQPPKGAILLNLRQFELHLMGFSWLRWFISLKIPFEFIFKFSPPAFLLKLHLPDVPGILPTVQCFDLRLLALRPAYKLFFPKLESRSRDIHPRQA